jgi:hypothetical protein
MSRSKNTPTFQYGIEITTPHSKLMYDHNDQVSAIMKINILNEWTKIWNAFVGIEEWDHDWHTIKSLIVLDSFDVEAFQKAICYSGFGSGFSILDVSNDIKTTVEDAENWRMHEMYQEMHEAGMVPTIKWEMVGFKDNYNKDFPTYASSFDVNGNEYTSPVLEDQLTNELESIESNN